MEEDKINVTEEVGYRFSIDTFGTGTADPNPHR